MAAPQGSWVTGMHTHMYMHMHTHTHTPSCVMFPRHCPNPLFS